MEKIRKNRTIWLSIILVILTIGLCVILFMPNENQTGATLTVGFIQTGEINDDGWNGEHYRAVKQACEKQGVELIVRENIDEMSGECEQAIRELANLGADMIILNSYNYGVEVSDVIEEYDGIAFYGISSEYRGENMSAYFVRMYQARYLAGIVAGMQSENGKIGYVAAMPNNEVNRGISAFALGVRSVAPEAEVIVTWTGSWDDEEKETEAVKQLVENEAIDTVTYHQNQEYVIRAAEELGILSIGYHEYFEGYSERYLTAAVSDWVQMYRNMIREVQQGKANSELNYWLGMAEGTVALAPYSGLVSEETIRAVEDAKEEILSGWEVFSGVIYDNQGELRCSEKEVISDTMLLENFDWYAEGVRIYEE